MKHNIVTTMIMCPGAGGRECDRIVTLEYDTNTGRVVAEGCPHIIHYSEEDLFDLIYDSFPAEELERRRMPRRGRRIKKVNPTAVDEEGLDTYDLGGEA